MAQSIRRLTSVPAEAREATGSDKASLPVEALLGDAIRGDLLATQLLLEHLAPAIYRAVRSVLGPNHPDLDDAVQQTLIALVQSLPRFRGECQPSTYALTIAIRAALATRRRRLRDTLRLEGLQVDPSTTSTPAIPSDALQAEHRRALVRRLLDQLPDEQAETLGLHVVLDIPLKEIAEAMGVSINTVKSRLRLAKQTLKERITGDQPTADALEIRS